MSSDRLDPAKSFARQNTVVAVSATLTTLSGRIALYSEPKRSAINSFIPVIIVSLRIYTRAVILRNPGKDDWAMVAALIVTVAYLATILVLRENGMGFSGAVLSLNQMTTTIKTILVVEIIYYLCVNSVKISIVLFYLRIAVERRFAMLCKGTIVFLGTFCTICIIVCLTQCIPLHKLWNFTGSVQGTCIHSTAFFYMTSSTNIIIDLWIIALPVKVLSSIQRPAREKYAVMGVFALGVLSCIASIVRLYSVRIYTTSQDPFYDSVPINTWSMVEVNIGIYCASVPSLKALFSKAQRERSQTAGYRVHGGERVETIGSKGSGPKKVRDEILGTITRNEEFSLSITHYGEKDARKQLHAAGHWSTNASKERIVVPQHEV
ncbi:Nn.00g013460.m01.CDS01 [Neocucurbitaria sp. VM-36]